MTEPKNALLSSIYSFYIDNVVLEFTPEALRAVAKKRLRLTPEHGDFVQLWKDFLQT